MKPEDEARINIDLLLAQADWVIQDYKDLNLGASLGVVVPVSMHAKTEFPLAANRDSVCFMNFKISDPLKR